jgi:predicted Fe-Mo cluster-binding NifX family protein
MKPQMTMVPEVKDTGFVKLSRDGPDVPKTLAITTFGDRVSPRLDCAESALLVTLEEGEIVGYASVRLVQSNPLQKIDLLVRLGVDALICGGLTEACAQKLETTDIVLMPWARGEVDDVLLEFLDHLRREREKRVENAYASEA